MKCKIVEKRHLVTKAKVINTSIQCTDVAFNNFQFLKTSLFVSIYCGHSFHWTACEQKKMEFVGKLIYKKNINRLLISISWAVISVHADSHSENFWKPPLLFQKLFLLLVLPLCEHRVIPEMCTWCCIPTGVSSLSLAYQCSAVASILMHHWSAEEAERQKQERKWNKETQVYLVLPFTT